MIRMFYLDFTNSMLLVPMFLLTGALTVYIVIVKWKLGRR